jgi:hypothetical protein
VQDWSHPRFSPDGEWLAFHFSHEKSPERFHIGIMRTDGTAFQCLTCNIRLDARRPVWFPDGKRLMFETRRRLDNVFYVLELGPRQLSQIKGMTSWRHLLEHNRCTMISPDGKKLIWTKVWVDGFRGRRCREIGNSSYPERYSAFRHAYRLRKN